MLIRQGTACDIEELVRVTDDGRASLRALGIDQWQGGTPRREVLVEDLEQGQTWFCADDDGSILGCMAFCLGGESDYDNIVEGAWLVDSPNVSGGMRGEPTYACVHRVAVSSGAQRRGVASKLLEYAKGLASEKGLASVRVDTHAGNIPMQRMLEKAGFVRCCTILLTMDEEPTKERIGYEFVL